MIILGKTTDHAVTVNQNDILNRHHGMLFLEYCVIGKGRLTTDISAEGKVNDQQKAKGKGKFDTAYGMKHIKNLVVNTLRKGDADLRF